MKVEEHVERADQALEAARKADPRNPSAGPLATVALALVGRATLALQCEAREAAGVGREERKREVDLPEEVWHALQSAADVEVVVDGEVASARISSNGADTVAEHLRERLAAARRP